MCVWCLAQLNDHILRSLDSNQAEFAIQKIDFSFGYLKLVIYTFDWTERYIIYNLLGYNLSSST